MGFYRILGVPADADEVTIRRAYKVLARRYHPDSGAGSSAEKFCGISEAYETLTEPGRRRVYDLSRPRPQIATPVRAEPMVRDAERFESTTFEASLRSSAAFYNLLNAWLRSLE